MWSLPAPCSPCHLRTTSLDIFVGCLSSEQENPHLEAPLSRDCMQGNENTGSNQTSDLKMSKFKKAFTKGGMERASSDNDWDSGTGIEHSTEEGTKKEPLISISPPNPKILTLTHCTLYNRLSMAFYCAFSSTEDAHLRPAHTPLFILRTASEKTDHSSRTQNQMDVGGACLFILQ